jgi:bifunctional non-homologous end joining protein LigD
MMGDVLPPHSPMLAASGSAVRGLDRAEWRFEPKLDGWRALAYIDGGAVRVRTRKGRDITGSVPELAQPPQRLRKRDAILDGELIVGGGGATDFYRLGPRLARRGQRASADCPVTFVAFDVVWLDGASTCARPYLERRRLLERLRVESGCWRTVDSYDVDPLDLLIACDRLDIEGVVAKRVNGRYVPGQRSPAWIKVKTPSWRERHAGRRHDH